jgi:predicted permease
MSDFRYALRTFRRNPAFAAVTIALIALGIGASGVVFCAFDALILRDLPVREPWRLFEVVQTLPQLGKRSDQGWDVYSALHDRSTLASDILAESYRDLALTGPGPAEQVRVHFVSPNYFSGLGVGAAIGRVLAPDDVSAVVLSYEFWKRRFAGDASALGKTLAIRGSRFTIVGVTPREFSGFSIDTTPDVRLPFAALKAAAGGDEKIEGSFFDIAIRLRDGVSVAQASAETNSIWRSVMLAEAEKTPDWRLEKGIELEPLEHGFSRLRDRFANPLMFLGAAVGLLMLMVCANVAGLLLARAAQREPEIAMRVALGASRWRLIRQTLAESILLALFGCVLGIALTYGASPLLVRALPVVRDFTGNSLPVALNVRPNARVLAWAVLASFGAAILFGLAPALRVSKIRSNRVASGWKGRRALVIAQVALCTMLLAAAGLLVRTLENLEHTDPGFDRDHIVTFSINPALSGYTDAQTRAFKAALLERVRSLQGVRSAAVSALGLMRGTGMKTTIARTGEKPNANDFLNSSLNFVSTDYFDAMGMRILSGRAFSAADALAGPPIPVVVNRAFALRFFPNEDPVGKTFGSGAPNAIAKDSFVITGVVSDARYRSIRETVPPTIYQTDRNQNLILHVRTEMRPETVIAPVREIVRSLDPAMPVIEARTLAQEVDATLWSERLVATLAAVFGGLAALLAAIGIYGLLAYAVAQRTREIGIRVALGAAPGRVLQLIGAQSALLVTIGVAVGSGIAYFALPLVKTLLYGVEPGDLGTFATGIVIVLAIATIATAVPAARALRVDPAIALRQD